LEDIMSTVPDLLAKTSRTFALTIPLLPEPTKEEVSVAYLLFRVADSFEDATRWSAAERVAALHETAAIFESDDREAAHALAERCLRTPPLDHAGYLELIGELPFVLDRCATLQPRAAELIRAHAARTARGMARFVGGSDGAGVLRLETLAELRDYCYVVAGVVGELCTELFLLGRSGLDGAATRLRERAASFGEALQLVNIVKDANTDAGEERYFLPATVDRRQVYAVAREDLVRANEYTQTLFEAGAPRGLVGFNLLAIRLATRTLAVVEQRGPGSKLSRTEVFAEVAAVARELDAGQPAFAIDQQDVQAGA
jgi:farnesyl-diphosphate farnesyltransferase